MTQEKLRLAIDLDTRITNIAYDMECIISAKNRYEFKTTVNTPYGAVNIANPSLLEKLYEVILLDQNRELEALKKEFDEL